MIETTQDDVSPRGPKMRIEWSAENRHMGSRVRLRRVLIGLSQSELGRRLGVTFQQIQKYESGANRIGAVLLFHMAEALDSPISFFYDGLSSAPALDGDAQGSTTALHLFAELKRISDPMVRKQLQALVRAVADAAHTD